MFETAELGRKVDKVAFKKQSESLRVQLLEAQRTLAGSDLSCVVVIGGAEGAGKSTLAGLFLEWMDARGIEVHALGEPSDEERERPRFWRFWRMLPPKGKMGIFVGSWYTQPIVDRVFKRADDGALEEEFDRIVAFEKMLVQENTILLKFWLHLSKAAQRRRLKSIEKDPLTKWRVTKQDWDFFKKYDKFRKVCERAISRTNTATAPWRIIDAEDRRYRSVEAIRATLQEIRDRVEVRKAAKAEAAPPKPDLPKPTLPNVLSRLDLTQTLTEKQYERQIEEYQAKLNRLTRRMYEKRRSMILVFEGPDAAGKGGTIRHLAQAIDARSVRVIGIAAPTDEERAHPYLWRFWRHLPRLGRVTIFDRSWYGRVMVERLEGFCRPEDWQRAYEEIARFEADLVEFGNVLVKYWIAISPEEQLKRFKDRQQTPYKQYKITEEDWRNRAKWDGYQAAACDMIERTSTDDTPWVLVAGNDKRWARVQVLKSACERLERGLG